MRIGAVADEAAVSTRMVRHYADHGLLSPSRDSNGYRSFEPSDVARVRQIQSLLHLGMSVAQIREVHGCLGSSPSVPTCLATLEALRAQLRDIDMRIEDLTELRGRLRQTLSEAGP